MSNLLQVIRLKSQAMQKKRTFPLMVDVPVNPELAPFLVSSSKGVLWIEAAHPGDLVKAAVRQIESPGEFFQEVLQAVSERGAKDQWGNVHPFTGEGVREAIHHLEFYGIEEIEILVPRLRGEENKNGPHERPAWLTEESFNVPVRPSSWIPDKCAVVVPVDRDFLGTLAHFTPKQVMSVIHNPSRGMAIAKGGVE